MELLRCKVRIAALWVFMAVAMAAHSQFAVMTPGGLEKTISEVEAMGPGMLVFMSLLGLVPLWLAFVSITVKGSSNRWVNFVLGIIFTILNIWHFVEHLAEPSVEQIMIVGSAVVFTALIAWYAWKLPKEEA
jgi:drug/metabolite transporter (DMT)-like permease